MDPNNYKKILQTPGFLPYLWTECLGAFNDNVFKMVLILMAINADLHSAFKVALIGAIFILPFILFSGYAGYFADVYNKRKVLIVTKTLEIVAMLLAFVILPLENFWLGLIVLFLLLTQATFFSPAKYGILPEVFDKSELVQANGLVEMTTYMAIILGSGVGVRLHNYFSEEKTIIGIVLVFIAVLGWLSVWWVPKTKAPKSKTPFPHNPWREIKFGLDRLQENQRLKLVVIGICWFWFAAALLQLALIVFSKEVLHLNDAQTGNLQTSLGIGIVLGALFAGKLSADRIEIGLIPFGALGIGIGLISLAFSSSVIISLLFIGFCAGLYIVPLNAILQQTAEKIEKGRLIATTNTLAMTGVFLAAGALFLLHDLFGFSTNVIILIVGFSTIILTGFAVTVMPEILLKFVLWIFMHIFYRIKVIEVNNIPKSGPALLIANHLSFVDALLIGAASGRHICFMMIEDFYNLPFLTNIFRKLDVISVRRGRGIKDTFAEARQALQAGKLVCIFVEGGISRIGNMLPFKRGYLQITEGLDIPIIPVNLDNIWGSMFSFNDSRLLLKRPRQLPCHITVSFGKPMLPYSTPIEVWQAVRELSATAFAMRRTVCDILPRRFLKTARRNFWRLAIADSSGRKMRYLQTVITAKVLADRIAAHASENNIGILLPASVGGAMANIAVSMAGKTSVNINFTSGQEAFDSIVKQCQIKTIITSRKFIERIEIDLHPVMVYIEDFVGEVTLSEKVMHLIKFIFSPASMLCKKVTPQSIATIMFSSGTTGEPKGVQLSHSNILANIAGISQIFPHNKHDKFIGVLPFFHSFGYTVTIWFPITQGMASVFHYNPMEAKTIAQLIKQYKTTFMLATPTFYQTYTSSLSKDDLQPIKYAIVGAEKLSFQVAEEFKAKFGKELFEGYGCTETSPVIAVNAPDYFLPSVKWLQKATKIGSVGMPLPGVAVKTIDPETGEDLPLGSKGMLAVKGSNVMVGYLGQPKCEEWYKTGDIAEVDNDGFITIIDRYARFSKIGGEMVPHLKIEQEINAILDGGPCIVIAIEDKKKRESLVVLYVHPIMSAAELWTNLNAGELPKIWIPKHSHIFKVDALPVLGSGKIDLQKAKELARQRLLQYASR